MAEVSFSFMDITSLEKGLTFCGRVKSVRQTYYVFDARDYFLVMSFSGPERSAGYFNVVEKKAVQYVHNRFAGKRGVTSNAVVDQAHRTTHAPSSLAALNILYVLVAIRAARIEKQGQHQQLFFRVMKGSA